MNEDQQRDSLLYLVADPVRGDGGRSRRLAGLRMAALAPVAPEWPVVAWVILLALLALLFLYFRDR